MKYSLLFLIYISFFSCSKTEGIDDAQKKMERNFINNKMWADNKKYREIISSPNFHFAGIEAVYISIGRPYYSWLGHIIIRFVDSGNRPEDDLAISFLPLFDTPSIDNLKAYYGGYPIFPVVKTWNEFINEYVHGEKRYLEQHRLKASSEQKDRLKKIIQDWTLNPLSVGGYSFKRLNCTYWQLHMLQEAGINVDKSKVVFPIDLINYLKELGLISQSYARIN